MPHSPDEKLTLLDTRRLQQVDGEARAQSCLLSQLHLQFMSAGGPRCRAKNAQIVGTSLCAH